MSKESRERLRHGRIEREWKDLYAERVARHESELQRTAERLAVELHDPNKLASLGLPTEMPEESLRILGRAMAFDVVGPRLPKVDRYCDPLGNPPHILHKFD